MLLTHCLLSILYLMLSGTWVLLLLAVFFWPSFSPFDCTYCHSAFIYHCLVYFARITRLQPRCYPTFLPSWLWKSALILPHSDTDQRTAAGVPQELVIVILLLHTQNLLSVSGFSSSEHRNFIVCRRPTVLSSACGQLRVRTEHSKRRYGSV